MLTTDPPHPSSPLLPKNRNSKEEMEKGDQTSFPRAGKNPAEPVTSCTTATTTRTTTLNITAKNTTKKKSENDATDVPSDWSVLVLSGVVERQRSSSILEHSEQTNPAHLQLMIFQEKEKYDSNEDKIEHEIHQPIHMLGCTPSSIDAMTMPSESLIGGRDVTTSISSSQDDLLPPPSPPQTHDQRGGTRLSLPSGPASPRTPKAEGLNVPPPNHVSSNLDSEAIRSSILPIAPPSQDCFPLSIDFCSQTQSAFLEISRDAEHVVKRSASPESPSSTSPIQLADAKRQKLDHDDFKAPLMDPSPVQMGTTEGTRIRLDVEPIVTAGYEQDTQPLLPSQLIFPHIPRHDELVSNLAKEVVEAKKPSDLPVRSSASAHERGIPPFVNQVTVTRPLSASSTLANLDKSSGSPVNNEPQVHFADDEVSTLSLYSNGGDDDDAIVPSIGSTARPIPLPDEMYESSIKQVQLKVALQEESEMVACSAISRNSDFQQVGIQLLPTVADPVVLINTPMDVIEDSCSEGETECADDESKDIGVSPGLAVASMVWMPATLKGMLRLGKITHITSTKFKTNALVTPFQTLSKHPILLNSKDIRSCTLRRGLECQVRLKKSLLAGRILKFDGSDLDSPEIFIQTFKDGKIRIVNLQDLFIPEGQLNRTSELPQDDGANLDLRIFSSYVFYLCTTDDSIRNLIRLLGGQVLDDIHEAKERKPNSSSVIFLAREPNESENYLMALALRIPIVSYNWITRSFEKNALIDKCYYRLSNGLSKSLGHFSFAPYSTVGVFAGLRFHVLSSNKSFTLKWSRIIVAGNGAIEADPPNTSMSDLYVLSERIDSPCALALDSGKLIRVDPTWIIQRLVDQII